MQGSTSILRITARFFQIGVLAFLGAIIVHTLVMVAEFYLVERIELNIRNDFMGAIISMPMLPMLVAYGFLVACLLVLWHRTREALIDAHQRELSIEKEKAVRTAMQDLTASLAGKITVHNAEILKWISLQKGRGRQVSERLEHASQQIAMALHDLSELAFVTGYQNPARLLQHSVSELTPLTHAGGRSLVTVNKSAHEGTGSAN